MKLLPVVLIASLSLLHLGSCVGDDYQQPPGGVDSGKSDDIEFGKVNENMEDEAHDSTLDEEALVGGKAARRRLAEMPPEEAKKEIRKLVERIDTNSDGQLDREELSAWLKKMEDKAYTDEAASVFAKEDTDRDGFVTFEEYMTNSGLPEDYADKEELESTRKNIRERFDIADTDKDRRLSKEEFGIFVHPDRHEEMLQHLVHDQLTRYDKDSDGKISFEEYMKFYNPSGKTGDEMPEWIVNEQREFEEKLDVNKDGYLDNEEIQQWIAPSDDEFIEEEVDHLINHIDENKDDKLSYDEVVEQLDVLIDSSLTDFGHLVHEEL